MGAIAAASAITAVLVAPSMATESMPAAGMAHPAAVSHYEDLPISAKGDEPSVDPSLHDAGSAARTIGEELPEGFAGSELDHDAKAVHVWVTDSPAGQSVRDRLSKIDGEFVFHEAKYSLAEMVEATEILANRWGKLKSQGVHLLRYGAETDGSGLHIEYSEESGRSAGDVDGIVESTLTNQGSTITVKYSTSTETSAATFTSRQDDGGTVTAGDFITDGIYGNQNNCTNGPNISLSGYHYTTTALHCALATNQNWKNGSTYLNVDSGVIGPQSSKPVCCTKLDASLIIANPGVENAAWTTSDTSKKTINRAVAVSNGDEGCVSGAYSLQQCGWVTAQNDCLDIDGVNICYLLTIVNGTQTYGLAGDGDSGGPVYTRGTNPGYLGLLTGGVGVKPCARYGSIPGRTCHPTIYVTRIQKILSYWNAAVYNGSN